MSVAVNFPRLVHDHRQGRNRGHVLDEEKKEILYHSLEMVITVAEAGGVKAVVANKNDALKTFAEMFRANLLQNHNPGKEYISTVVNNFIREAILRINLFAPQLDLATKKDLKHITVDALQTNPPDIDILYALKSAIEPSLPPEAQECNDVPLLHRFDFQHGRVLYSGQDLELAAGEVQQVLYILHDNYDTVVPYKTLSKKSYPHEADGSLRKLISSINRSFRKHNVPFIVKSRTSAGYLLIQKER